MGQSICKGEDILVDKVESTEKRYQNFVQVQRVVFSLFFLEETGVQGEVKGQ